MEQSEEKKNLIWSHLTCNLNIHCITTTAILRLQNQISPLYSKILKCKHTSSLKHCMESLPITPIY